MNRKLLEYFRVYFNENYKCDEEEIEKHIRDMLEPYKVATKLSYWNNIRKLCHTWGYTHWVLETPKDWIQDREEIVDIKRKNQCYTEISKKQILDFIHTELNEYNPYHEFIRLCIISGRRGQEIFNTEFEVRENVLLWYISLKKRKPEWYRCELLFGYSPDMFIEDLNRMRNEINPKQYVFQSLKYKLIPYLQQCIGTTKLHICRTIYVLFMIDNYKSKYDVFDTNNLVYYVCGWLNHDSIGSSQRYLQAKWV